MANGMFDNPANAFQNNFNQLYGQNKDAAYSYAFNSSNYDQMQPLLGNDYQSYVNRYDTNQGTMGSSVMNGNQLMYKGADGKANTYYMGNDASQGWLGLNGAMWGNQLGGQWNTGSNPYQAYQGASGGTFTPQPLGYGDTVPAATGNPPVAVDPAPANNGNPVSTTPSQNLGYDANGGYKGGDTAWKGAATTPAVNAGGPVVNNGGYTYNQPTTNTDYNTQNAAGGHTWQEVYDKIAANNPSGPVAPTNYNSLANAMAGDTAGQANNWVLRPPTAEAANTAQKLSSGFGNNVNPTPQVAGPGTLSQGLSGFGSVQPPPVTATADEFKAWGQQKYGPTYQTNPDYVRLANEHYAAQNTVQPTMTGGLFHHTPAAVQ